MIPNTQKYKDAVYAPSRLFKSRIKFTYEGVTKLYDNVKILSINILEETSFLNDTVPSNELTLTLDNKDGEFNFLTLQNTYNILSKLPRIEVEFGLVTSGAPEVIEWVPMGTFFITDWINDANALTVTIHAYDILFTLDNITYSNPNFSGSLYELAEDIFTSSGITDAELGSSIITLSLDDSLHNISSNGFKEAISAKEALRNVAIAGQCTFFQNRYHVLNVKKIATIENSSMFKLYAGQANVYAGANTYMVVQTEGGMKYIDYDDMYEIPKVSLEKVIFQLVIKVHNPAGNTYDRIYTNPLISGKNGISFTIDNELILTNPVADAVAEWFISQSNYPIVYETNWRQNPVLECLDMVIVEDILNSGKQVRIRQQEFSYEGYLNGNTVAKGGL